MNDQEVVAQLMGMGLAALIAGWVSYDARQRGLKKSEALGWGAGVLLLLIVFLPLYLFTRRKQEMKGALSPKVEAAPCPYCGYLNPVGANFCEKCNRQLKSSSEIHTR